MNSTSRRLFLPSFAAAAFLPMTRVEALVGPQAKPASGAASTTVYELRTYHTFEGKLPDLLGRFRDHTRAIFERHGLRDVAYFTPMDEPLAGRTLIYILAHASREAATANWAAFRNDPEWQQVSKASEANGKLVEKVDSVFMSATDFSPLL